MVSYRRHMINGGTYFFTLTLKNRQARYLIEHIDAFKAAYNKIKQDKPFKTLAYVILPDHGHWIWTLPEGDANYSSRWREIKKGFTKSLKHTAVKLNKNANGEYDLWQRRYWEHTIRDALDLENHFNYIHYNPVKHKLVSQVKHWPHSSFHHYVQRELLDLNWAGDCEDMNNSNGQGERKP